jgi:hypothetical protein
MDVSERKHDHLLEEVKYGAAKLTVSCHGKKRLDLQFIKPKSLKAFNEKAGPAGSKNK